MTPTASWQERYADRFYRSRPGWKDGTTEFYDLCSGAIRSGSKILDVGAGPTNQAGVFVFRCPNLWNYVSLIARLTPHWFHELVANKVRGLPEDHSAPYPTFHRLNTMRRCRKVLAAAGFEIVEMRNIEKQPSYGRFSRRASEDLR